MVMIMTDPSRSMYNIPSPCDEIPYIFGGGLNSSFSSQLSPSLSHVSIDRLVSVVGGEHSIFNYSQLVSRSSHECRIELCSKETASRSFHA